MAPLTLIVMCGVRVRVRVKLKVRGKVPLDFRVTCRVLGLLCLVLLYAVSVEIAATHTYGIGIYV